MKSHRGNQPYFKMLKAQPFAGRPFGSITTSDAIDMRERLLESYAPATVNKAMNIMSAIYSHATEWKMTVINPMRGIKRPRPGAGRTRRPTEEELQRIVAESGSKPLGKIITLAIETAMRRGEFANARPEHYRRELRTLVLYETKNGDGRAVPLSTRAMAVLDSLPPTKDGTSLACAPTA